MMLEQLYQFRFDLYNALPKRADAAFNLLDALASRPEAKSVVEIGLSSHFWGVFFGKHRNELTLEDIYGNFKQRFDLERFFDLANSGEYRAREQRSCSLAKQHSLPRIIPEGLRNRVCTVDSTSPSNEPL